MHTPPGHDADSSGQPDRRARHRPARVRRPRGIIGALAFAGLGGSFTTTIMLPLQSQLPALFGASRDDTAWVITITLLVGAVMNPIAGKLGDMYGRRRILLVLLATQFAGSVLAALSTDIVLLIVGRGMQGVGMGVVPLGIAIMRDTLHRDRLGPAIGLMSATLGIGGAIGLPLSGVVAQYFDWHALFWLSALIAAVGFALVISLVPVTALGSAGRLDVVGVAGMAVGFVCILLGITRGNVWGWGSPTTIGLFLGGVATLVVWGWWELRATNPVVDLRVSARPAVLLTNITAVLLGFGLFAGNIIYPQLLELPAGTGVGLGLSLLETSLIMLPHAVAMAVLSTVGGRMVGIVGPKTLLVTASVMVAAGYVISLLIELNEWTILGINVLLGGGAGTGYAALSILIMRSVPATETGAANGLNALMRSLGTSSAAAVIGAVLATSTTDFETIPVPDAGAFQLAFAIGLAAAVVCVGVALALPRRHRATDQRHDHVEHTP